MVLAVRRLQYIRFLCDAAVDDVVWWFPVRSGVLSDDL